MYRSKIITLLNMTLSRLAAGWCKQRGEHFDFGLVGGKEPKMNVGNLNQEKLKMAPINNFDPERNFGNINYELKIRGQNI